MRNVCAVFLKQVKETFKNQAILIQFVLFPVFAFVLENAIQVDDLPEHYFVKMFSAMFVGMAPLTAMSSILSEEKEANTLRALLMSNVKPVEYLLGVGSYILFMCMAGAAALGLCGEYTGRDFGTFLLVMGLGILTSILVGAVIGICSKNQMAATSVTVPVMMVFSFLPMLSIFNETIAKVAKFTYSQQVSLLINGIGTADITSENLVILGTNMAVAVVLFLAAFRKKGLE